jgi:hypothetical protein
MLTITDPIKTKAAAAHNAAEDHSMTMRSVCERNMARALIIGLLFWVRVIGSPEHRHASRAATWNRRKPR